MVIKTYNTYCKATPSWNLQKIVSELREVRNEWRTNHGRTRNAGRELPSRTIMSEIIDTITRALFPMRLGPSDLREESEDFYVGHSLDAALSALQNQAYLELCYNAKYQGTAIDDVHAQATSIVQEFAFALPNIRKLLDTDVIAAYNGDPAARSVDEVLLCYPGVLAIIYHRLAHYLYTVGLTLLARITAELAHSATGIDIHPGATIGESFFIDHGTGVVIGETCVIGNHVRIYQAVTLGAKRFTADESGHLQKGYPRHPIVEDDVVIYAGATILGRVTIGKGSTVGGNVWLTKSIPANSSITQASTLNETCC
ncbi:serine O-acetyltransferase EpsC [Entomomonas asaccharolytica]|uniref:serine O-acetyltransferase n=1 Tax=Entomomonas asaccharolytica TaxID=2785331 RepID=A0A974NFD6_9GAMM|nr:serine O-acetyltransferase EpsC [Entomomonas asaccharolytica]QQP85452.1 serine acetyltransferase [Entomomonas asaccharolytica]